MARIRIELPEHFIFSTEIPLFQSHINYAGHLDNVQILSLVSEARIRFVSSLGYMELEVEGLGMIMADAGVQYKSEAFYGETMRIEMTPDDWHAKGFDLVWRMSDRETGREVARGKSGMLFYDYKQGKVQPVPEAFFRRASGAGC